MEISIIKIQYIDIPQNISERKECICNVFNGDCFQASELYNNSVIHNFANNTRPGGKMCIKVY